MYGRLIGSAFGVFMPVFEKNGMIVEVDKHIWEASCKILQGWKDTYPDMFLSINISPRDFYFIDVVYELESLVARYGISAVNLRIEITESAMMADTAERIKIFDRLRTAGFVVEMDDFQRYLKESKRPSQNRDSPFLVYN